MQCLENSPERGERTCLNENGVLNRRSESESGSCEKHSETKKEMLVAQYGHSQNSSGNIANTRVNSTRS